MGLSFGVEAPFALKTRKKSRCDGRGCIFSKSPIVQAVAFLSVFGAGSDPGAVRLR